MSASYGIPERLSRDAGCPGTTRRCPGIRFGADVAPPVRSVGPRRGLFLVRFDRDLPPLDRGEARGADPYAVGRADQCGGLCVKREPRSRGGMPAQIAGDDGLAAHLVKLSRHFVLDHLSPFVSSLIRELHAISTM